LDDEFPLWSFTVMLAKGPLADPCQARCKKTAPRPA